MFASEFEVLSAKRRDRDGWMKNPVIGRKLGSTPNVNNTNLIQHQEFI